MITLTLLDATLLILLILHYDVILHYTLILYCTTINIYITHASSITTSYYHHTHLQLQYLSHLTILLHLIISDITHTSTTHHYLHLCYCTVTTTHTPITSNMYHTSIILLIVSIVLSLDVNHDVHYSSSVFMYWSYCNYHYTHTC